MNISGIAVGLGTFLIIGLLHPIVIKAEYYVGTKIWPLFLLLGIACIIYALFCTHSTITSLISVLGFSLLWSIQELFEQKRRVEKGWFPRNPSK